MKRCFSWISAYLLRDVSALYARSEDGRWTQQKGATFALSRRASDLAQALRAGEVSVVPLDVQAISYRDEILPLFGPRLSGTPEN